MKEKKPNKKLIEVSMPLDSINRACKKEIPVTQGHPKSIHPFFARRPSAAARAVLFASLVDDPGNSLPEKETRKERQRLHKLIGELVKWENTDNTAIFKKALTEIKKSYPGKLPKIYDPFCGGGIIPLEAQRLGLPVFASDLNPVSVLITKCLTEISQKFLGLEPVNPQVLQKEKSKGIEGVTADIEYYGKLVLKEAEKKLKRYYPKINNSNVIAWIWARIIICPNPACKAEIPLTGSFKISEKKGKAFWVSLEYDKKKRVSFKIKFDNSKIPEKTVRERKVFCPLCKESAKLKPYVMDEGRKGRIGEKIMAIVLENGSSLTVISPIKEHEILAESVKESYKPNAELPKYTETFKPINYGFSTYGDLFSNRQLLAINTFSESIQNMHGVIERDAIKAGMIDDKKPLQNEGKGARAYADTIVTYLALQLGRVSNYWSTFNPWSNSYVMHVFRRQGIYMTWDYAEVNPFSNRTASWISAIDFMNKILKKSIVSNKNVEVSQLDATSVFYPKDKPIVCTDPPYYNNISYSDLTDFFYVWLRRMLQKIFPDICSTLLCPKEQELIALPYRFDNDKLKADNFYEEGFKKVFTLFKNEANQEAPFTFFYAYKDEAGTRGWETMLQSLVSSGLQITGTWPLATESAQSLDKKRNVLSSSIIIVCRRRLKNTNLCTRREFISELRKEFRKTIAVLRDGNISPVDLSQVTIGPGMSIFSQFSQVLESNGKPMQIHTALEIINHELDSFFNERELDFDQNTRFCISWFDQFGFNKAAFGDADVLARSKNTTVETLDRLSLVESSSGKVKLKNPSEFEDVDLDNLNIWICTHYMINILGNEGIESVSNLITKIGVGLAETCKNLAYHLFQISEKKKMHDKALAYNTLISSWSDIIEKLGLPSVSEGQTRL